MEATAMKFKNGDRVHIPGSNWGNGEIVGKNVDGFIVKFVCGQVGGIDAEELKLGHRVQHKHK